MIFIEVNGEPTCNNISETGKYHEVEYGQCNDKGIY